MRDCCLYLFLILIGMCSIVPPHASAQRYISPEPTLPQVTNLLVNVYVRDGLRVEVNGQRTRIHNGGHFHQSEEYIEVFGYTAYRHVDIRNRIPGQVYNIPVTVWEEGNRYTEYIKVKKSEDWKYSRYKLPRRF